MKKRWTAALLALALAVTLLPGRALAAADDGTAGSRLTGADRAVYDILKKAVVEIADGDRSNTIVQVPDLSELSWTLAELMLGDPSRRDVLDALEKKLQESLHFGLIYSCLSADLPYHMYWKGNRYSWGYSYSRRGNRVAIVDLSISLQVAEAYRSSNDVSVSADKVAAAQAASDKAKAIVEKYRDQPDYEKLRGYFQEICMLVDYNDAAARGGMPYGDPWQLVYVFDGDPATNVVCEGYSKAFKYLCDLTDFDGDILCRLATGRMNGGSHMWNVVRMEDGQDYVVDVTNCDNGIGSPDRLFLSGAAGQDDGRSYTVSKGQCVAAYIYDEDERDFFVDGYLTVSGEDYVYDPSKPAAQPEAPAFTDLEPGEYYVVPVAWAVEKKITDGTTETTFSPDQACTHGEILTFLWRAAGRQAAEGPDPYGGISEEEFFYDAVRWADGLGMLDMPAFDPYAPCSRASAVTYIWAAFGWPEAPPAAYEDVAEDAPFVPAVAWAVEQEVTKGATETTFEPETICSRGQIVTFLYRAYH